MASDPAQPESWTPAPAQPAQPAPAAHEAVVEPQPVPEPASAAAEPVLEAGPAEQSNAEPASPEAPSHAELEPAPSDATAVVPAALPLLADPTAAYSAVPADGAADGTAVLPRADASPTETTTVFDARDAADAPRSRWTMVASTLLGTLGLLMALAGAGLDQLRYNQATNCATYATAHKGQHGFGCSATAKHVAVLAPAIGLPLLVLAMLAVIWVPQRTRRSTRVWLSVFLALLVVVGVVIGSLYTALPQG